MVAGPAILNFPAPDPVWVPVPSIFPEIPMSFPPSFNVPESSVKFPTIFRLKDPGKLTPDKLSIITFLGPFVAGNSAAVIAWAEDPLYSRVDVDPYPRTEDAPSASVAVPCKEAMPLIVVVSEATVAFMPLPESVKFV